MIFISEGLRSFLPRVICCRRSSGRTSHQRRGIAKFTVDTVDAPFHFDEPILDYLNNIGSLASALLVDEQTAAGLANEDPELTERIRTNRRWLQDEIQQKLITKNFLPYLAIDPATRL